MRKLVHGALLLGGLIVGQNLQAQIDARFTENIIPVSDSAVGSVMLSVNNLNYLRNYEYMSPIQYGYTLLGSQLSTQVAIQPTPFMRVQAGLLMQHEFGSDGLQRVEPILSMKLSKRGYSFIFGALEGTVAHRLYEPLYNYERIITHPVENGFQFKTQKYNSWSDTWIQWEYRQRAGVMEQERLTAGHSSEWTVYKNGHWLVQLKPQGLIHHRGGQLSPSKMDVQSLLQVALGARLQKTYYGQIRSWWFEPAYFYYNDLSNTKELPFNTGTGLYINAGIQTKWPVSVSAGYWKGNQFLSGRGGWLFASQSAPYGKPGYIEAQRELLLLRVLYQQSLFKGLNMDIRFEPYYDMKQQRLEYAYSLFLSYKLDAKLVQLQPVINSPNKKTYRP
jgi:hypothetical protein